jgi:hypothetical protein
MHYSPVLFKKSSADIPSMEAYGARLSTRFCLDPEVPNDVTICGSKYTPTPHKKLKQFYLLTPIGGVIGRQFTITYRHENYAKTFTNIVVLILALIIRSAGAMDILRLFSEVGEQK